MRKPQCPVLSLPCLERIKGFPSRDMPRVSIGSKELWPKEAWDKRAGPRKPPRPQPAPPKPPKRTAGESGGSTRDPSGRDEPSSSKSSSSCSKSSDDELGPTAEGTGVPPPQKAMRERMSNPPPPRPHSAAATGASVGPAGAATGAPDEHRGDVQTNGDWPETTTQPRGCYSTTP